MNDCKYLRLLLALLLAFALVFTTFSGCERSKDNSDNKKDTSDTNDSSVSIEPPITTLPREKKYSVSLTLPAQNHIFDKNDPPPVFTWKTYEDFPDFVFLEMVYEVDYKQSPALCSVAVRHSAAFVLDDMYWRDIKNKAKVIDGMQKIDWRISIIDPMDLSKEPYNSEWSSFWIKN